MKRYLILLSVLIACLHLYLLTDFTRAVVVYPALVILAYAVYKRARQLAAASLLMVVTYEVVPRLIPDAWFDLRGSWYMISSLLVVAVMALANLNGWRDWWRVSSAVTWRTRVFMAATVVLSSAALVAWALLVREVDGNYPLFVWLGQFQAWVVFLVIIPFLSLFNAVAEELFFRGILQDALSEYTQKLWLVIAVQALAFAAIHYAGGFPNGKLGYLMTFVYGAALGYLRWRTKSLRVPTVVHALADYTIFCLLMRFAG